MPSTNCTAFLKWALPRLGKQWDGYCKVTGQVRSRLTDRLHELGLRSLGAYRDYLSEHPEEWTRLDAMCRITVSRFYRDRGVFEQLRNEVLPALAREHVARGASLLHAWSAGAASGEEPYTLRILWRHALHDHYEGLPLHVTATEVQPHMLRRARRACYPRGTLKHLPDAWIDRAFVYDAARDEGPHAEPYVLRPIYRRRFTWRLENLRATMPDGPFALILCRNLVFTYFVPTLQCWCLDRLLRRLRPGGVLILGKHETLPEGEWPLIPIDEHKRIYRHAPCKSAG